jgi:hypothetical protein
MKKLFLLVAFTGIVAASSASTLVSLTKGTVITLGEEKKGDEKKKKKKKSSEKACCKKDGAAASEAKAEGKSCHSEAKAEGKSCCKKTAEASAAPAATPATEKK